MRDNVVREQAVLANANRHSQQREVTTMFSCSCLRLPPRAQVWLQAISPWLPVYGLMPGRQSYKISFTCSGVLGPMLPLTPPFSSASGFIAILGTQTTVDCRPVIKLLKRLYPEFAEPDAARRHPLSRLPIGSCHKERALGQVLVLL